MIPIPYYFYNLTNPTLPKFYYQVKSQEQMIAALACATEGLKDHGNQLTDQVNENTGDIEQLQGYVDAIQKGEYVDGYIDQLAAYIDKNLISFVARLAQYVFPILYWDGECYRYAVVVPESWNWLKFQWVWVEDDHSYHIVLTY